MSLFLMKRKPKTKGDQQEHSADLLYLIFHTVNIF